MRFVEWAVRQGTASVRFVQPVLIARAAYWTGMRRSPFVRENGRMRPGNQNNKRMRGRGRKGPNPLTRTYESNGPDVKIRGTALHVAEKYQQLARDAQAGGDRVMSENYYQHAEHYLRIVAAAQSQMQQPVMLPRNDDGDEDDVDMIDERRDRDVVAGLQPTMPLDAPQPFIDRMPGINTKDLPAINGSGQAEADDGGRGEDDGAGDEARMRRRSRGARGRGMRRGRGDGPAEQGGDGWQQADGDDRPDAEQLPASLIARSRPSEPVSEAREAPEQPAAAQETGQEDAAPEKKPRTRRPARSRAAKADKSESETPATTEA